MRIQIKFIRLNSNAEIAIEKNCEKEYLKPCNLIHRLLNKFVSERAKTNFNLSLMHYSVSAYIEAVKPGKTFKIN